MLNEIILHPGEHREIILLNEPDTNWHIIQEAGSTLLLHVIALPHPNDEAQWHTSITVEHKATGCKTEMYGLALLHSQQQHHLTTRVLHNVGGGYSSQLFKFVLDDESKASFKGELKILPDAQQVEAYQTNRNILLSRQAEMTTEPQLEIYADDVKCSHGATIGRLNEEEQFYMRSRGITLEDAKVLQMISFIAPVIEQVPESDREAMMVSFEDAVRTLIK